MVAEGTFRPALYYRINVMTIHAPGLADHPEDIPLLAKHFLLQYAKIYNKNVDAITRSAMERLERYLWPGNVRELENAIQSAIIRADSDSLALKDLPEQLQGHDIFERNECPRVAI